MTTDKDPPSLRRLLIYCSRIEDGRKMEEIFSRQGIKIRCTHDLRDAKMVLERQNCNFLVVAVSGSDCDGIRLLEWANDTILGVRKFGVAMTQCDTLYNKVYKLGADCCFYYDSLVFDRLSFAIEEIFNDSDKEKWYQRRSSGFQDCTRRIVSESNNDGTLLLTGPHGVGKSAIARVIHDNSVRRNGKFIVAECAHYTGDSESMDIFRGKETGVKHPLYRNQQGLLAQANDGTLFIHEVSRLPIAVQEVLATVIQRGVFMPKNMTKEVPFTGRVIISTTEDLGRLVIKGEFSEALYHCISSSIMSVPSLAECQEDVVPLAQAFISQFCDASCIPLMKLTKGAINKLEHHIWAGNVRELFGVISRACSDCDGKTIGKDDITLADLPRPDRHTRRFKIKKALRHTKGNKAKASELLGINRTTLYKWMKEEGIRKDYR